MSEFESYVPRQRFLPTLSFSPDGTRIAYSCNASGQYNLWVTGLTGQPRQLTSFTDDAVREVAWSPDGRLIAFAADRHGNEQHQIHVIEPDIDGAVPRALTAVLDRQFGLAERPFGPDSSTLAYTGNDRDEACTDLLVRDLRTDEVRRVQTTGVWDACSISPDGRWLLALRAFSNTRTELYTVDLLDPNSGPVLRTPEGDQAAHWGGPWSADSASFYDRTDAGADFRALRLVRLADGSSAEVAAPPWDIESTAVSADGSTLAWTVNEAGRSRPHVRRGDAEVELPEVPGGVVLAMALSPDGARLAVVLNTATRPADLAMIDIAAGTFRYLTDSRPPALSVAAGVEPRLISYPTHDGREIPAWLYLPHDDGGPFPFLLSVHGGPEAQERPQYAYAGLYQYLLANGIGVLAPNIRGSAGYGASYQKLIYRDWGGAELGDLEHAALYLRGRGDVDPARIAVYGGSFGGFATLSCVSRLPQYWAAGVSVVGPSNLLTFTRSVPATWRPLLAEWIGDPDADADLLIERSPITYAHQIVAPLMVVQGANDPRVVQAESDQIVESLRARGVEVRYDVYPDEGHGFTNRDNEIKALTDVGHFLTEHLNRRS